MPSRTGRRQFLAATAAGVGVLAGCTEGDSQPTDNGNSESLEDRMPDTSPATVEGNDFSVDSSSSTSEGERRQLLQTYNEGIVKANDGMRLRERGVGAWNDEKYSRSEQYSADAENEFRDAESQFNDALDIAYGLDYPDAQDACETAIEYCSIRSEAARAAQLAARAAQRGDGDSANQRVDETRSLEREASRLTVLDTSTLERILDLD